MVDNAVPILSLFVDSRSACSPLGRECDRSKSDRHEASFECPSIQLEKAHAGYFGPTTGELEALGKSDSYGTAAGQLVMPRGICSLPWVERSAPDGQAALLRGETRIDTNLTNLHEIKTKSLYSDS